MQKIPGEIKLSPFFVVYFNWHYTLFLFALRRLLVGVVRNPKVYFKNGMFLL